MGTVKTKIKVTNYHDFVLAEQGALPFPAIRSIEIEGALMDTGATGFSLPQKAIVALGLPFKKNITSRTAGGIVERRQYSGARLEIGSRDMILDVTELPDEVPPLVGVVPMQYMGLELDLANHVVRFLPDSTADSYHWFY